jgi:hypothetical protein
MGWEGKGGPFEAQTPNGYRPFVDVANEGRKKGSKVPPAKRKAKRRRKKR